MRPFSDDLRLRIHDARQAGESTAEVAERFGVSTAFVRRPSEPLDPITLAELDEACERVGIG